jgi:type IV fimbrial biogenesis protein FimT
MFPIFKRRFHKRSIIKTPKTIIGFTLIELVIAIAIASILLLIAIPGFQDMLFNNRMSAVKDGLLNALNYARNMALDQEVNMKVCPFSAVGSVSCGANWSAGWIVITNPPIGAITLLQSRQSVVTDPVLTSAVNAIVFDPNGVGTTQTNFKLCDVRGAAFAQSVQVLATGFVQSGDIAGQAVWDGSALTCP